MWFWIVLCWAGLADTYSETHMQGVTIVRMVTAAEGSDLFTWLSCS